MTFTIRVYVVTLEIEGKFATHTVPALSPEDATRQAVNARGGRVIAWVHNSTRVDTYRV